MADDAEGKEPPGLTVFKAINKTRKEILVGTTIFGMHQLIEQHRVARPPAISHWKQSDKVDYRSIKVNLPVEDAVELVETCAQNLTRTSGWKVLRQRA